MAITTARETTAGADEEATRGGLSPPVFTSALAVTLLLLLGHGHARRRDERRPLHPLVSRHATDHRALPRMVAGPRYQLGRCEVTATSEQWSFSSAKDLATGRVGTQLFMA